MKRRPTPPRTTLDLLPEAERIAPFLSSFERMAQDLIALPIDAVPAGDAAWLTGSERDRRATFGARRARGFVAARVALKLLARRCGWISDETPDAAVHTFDGDGRPTVSCAGAAGFRFSVSHNERYVIAVAGREPIGVDVERISARLLSASRRFVFADEVDRIQRAIDGSLGSLAILARIWTAKEACAKAFDLPLFQALRAVRADSVGAQESRMHVSGRPVPVIHATIGDHVFALVALEPHRCNALRRTEPESHSNERLPVRSPHKYRIR